MPQVFDIEKHLLHGYRKDDLHSLAKLLRPLLQKQADDRA